MIGLVILLACLHICEGKLTIGSHDWSHEVNDATLEITGPISDLADHNFTNTLSRYKIEGHEEWWFYDLVNFTGDPLFVATGPIGWTWAWRNSYENVVSSVRPREGSDQAIFDIVNENGDGGASSGLLLYKGGTVCRWDFDRDNVPARICSYMGYKYQKADWTSPGIIWDIQDGYNITLSNVDCSGDRWSWPSCTHSYDAYCGHKEDVFLACISHQADTHEAIFDIVDENGDGGGRSGLLVYKGGTVCDDGFSQNAAGAICLYMGFKAEGWHWSHWTSGKKWDMQDGYDITLGKVNCELGKIWPACTQFELHDCDHNDDVFLACTSDHQEVSNDAIHSFLGFDIVDESGDGGVRSGLLLYNGGTVGDADDFDQDAADTICFRMGYNPKGSQWTSGYKWKMQDGYRRTLDTVDCASPSKSWSQCSYTDTFFDYDHHDDDVFLTCTGHQGVPNEVIFDIVDENGGGGVSSGLLLFNGSTVCGDNFDQDDAKAICSFLGYDYWTGPHDWTSRRSRDSWDIQDEYSITLITDTGCMYQGGHWSRCTYSESHNCSHEGDVFLTCTKDGIDEFGVDIVDSEGVGGKSSGLLTVVLLYRISYGISYLVCDDKFNQDAADAICSHMGYKTSRSEWYSGTSSWDYQYRYGRVSYLGCSNSSWSSCSYHKYRQNAMREICGPAEDVFLTCTGQQEVDGGWSDYGDWATCSTSGSDCVKSRSRECNNPAPVGDGADCQGNEIETSYCHTYGCSEYDDCRYTGTDFLGGDMEKVMADTEEECVSHCMVSNECVAVTFVGPNPDQYADSSQGCYKKSGNWTVRKSTHDYQANMISVDVTCIRDKRDSKGTKLEINIGTIAALLIYGIIV